MICAMFLQRVQVVAAGCLANSVMHDTKKPFYNKDFIKSLKEALSTKQFSVLRKKLLDLQKF
ncbi:hypothetical protein ACFL2U_02305 [Patescibacteria group bacterium]